MEWLLPIIATVLTPIILEGVPILMHGLSVSRFEEAVGNVRSAQSSNGQDEHGGEAHRNETREALVAYKRIVDEFLPNLPLWRGSVFSTLGALLAPLWPALLLTYDDSTRGFGVSVVLAAFISMGTLIILWNAKVRLRDTKEVTSPIILTALIVRVLAYITLATVVILLALNQNDLPPPQTPPP